MKHRFRLALLTSLCSVFFASLAAQADPISINLQNFRPTLGPGNLITIDGTRTPGAWMPMANLGFDWSYRPLKLANHTISGEDPSYEDAVNHVVTLHLMAGLGITKWFSLGFEVPVVAHFSFADKALSSGDFVDNISPGFGDFRLFAKFRIVNNQDGGFGFAFVPQVIFPLGDGNQLRGISSAGNNAFGFDVRFALDYKFKMGAFVALNLGFFGRTSDQLLLNARISHEVTYALGGYVPFGTSGVGAMLELAGSTSVINAIWPYSPLVTNAGIRYNHRSGFVAGAGFGIGITPAPGNPQFRLFANIGYEKFKEEKKPVPTPAPLPESPQTVVDGDRDGDTVLDKNDPCPDVAGPVENQGCPWPDTDGDTVLDKDDACPKIPGLVDNKGCPADPDTDKDGLSDKEDKCPYEPGPRENKGCPAPKKFVQVTQNEIKLLQQILFATNKADIKKASFGLLDEIVSVLRARPTMTLHIGGHTDTRGKLAWNMTLSGMRADSVMQYLIIRGGIDKSRLTAQGYGPTVPPSGTVVQSLRDKLNKAPAAKKKKIMNQMNDLARRTEFKITKQ